MILLIRIDQEYILKCKKLVHVPKLYFIYKIYVLLINFYTIVYNYSLSVVLITMELYKINEDEPNEN